MSWRTAFLRQAYSDYEMFLHLAALPDIPLHHQLHYLQMTTEKLAKGLMTPLQGGPPERTHDAFLRFLRVAKNIPHLQAACRIPDTAQYRAYLQGLAPVVQEIENLSPEGADHPNPEYPWEHSGQIFSPLDYAFTELQLQQPRMIRLIHFLDACFRFVERELV